MTKVYADRKNGVEVVEDTPINKAIDTYGVLIYQETLLTIAKRLAGFNSADSIVLLKSVGKKDAKKLFALEDKFVSGCKRVGILSETESKSLFDNIKAAARYSFNKSISSESLTKCQDGSTKTIAQIQAGDEVMTPTGFAKVIAKYDHGVMDTYSVTLSNGMNLKCSINHKFLCDGGDILPLWQILSENREIITE
jgi:hypothetical protein